MFPPLFYQFRSEVIFFNLLGTILPFFNLYVILSRKNLWHLICMKIFHITYINNITFADKGPYSQSCDFSSSYVWMQDLDHNEG